MVRKVERNGVSWQSNPSTSKRGTCLPSTNQECSCGSGEMVQFWHLEDFVVTVGSKKVTFLLWGWGCSLSSSAGMRKLLPGGAPHCYSYKCCICLQDWLFLLSPASSLLHLACMHGHGQTQFESLGMDKMLHDYKPALMLSLWFNLRYNLLPRIIEAKYLDAMDAEH